MLLSFKNVYLRTNSHVLNVGYKLGIYMGTLYLYDDLKRRSKNKKLLLRRI